MGAELVIDRAGPGDAADWDDFAATHPGATCYHRYAFRAVFEQGLGNRTAYLLARSAHGSVCGLLPLVHLKSRLFGNYFVSVPYANYGGALGADPDVEARLMERAGEVAAAAGASHVEFRDTRPRDDGLPVRTDKVEMIMELEADTDALWKRIGSKIRAQVKRPRREGATTRRGGTELLDAFYDVFAVNMRDLGTPVYPRRLFATILEQLGDAAELVVVDVDGEPAAAGLLIHHGTTTEIPSASSLRAFNRLGVNMMLYWECLSAAVERGSGRFDFGRSTPDSGTFRFKKQWGAEPNALYWHYWLADGAELPNLSPANARYALAIRTWTRLPVWLTRVLGPPIVRNLP